MNVKELIIAIASLLLLCAATQEGRVHVYTRTRVVTEWTTVACTTTAVQTDPMPTLDHVSQESTSNQQSDPTPSAGPSASGSKRGIAYNKAELTAHFVRSDKISWAWNWDSAANGLDPDIDFVPTLWGPIDEHTRRWRENANAAIAKNSTHLLSFNECDRSDQCNLAEEAAADAHVAYMNPFGDRVKIGAPSVSNSNLDGEGLDWLDKWVHVCASRGCRYDFCTIHWYSPLSATDTLYTHIREASRICGGKPVWLTEFALLDDSGAQAAPSEASVWLESVLPMLDDLPELERYSYFMVSEGKLVNDLELTVSGQAYLDRDSRCPQ